jgi:hypothetical protein
MVHAIADPPPLFCEQQVAADFSAVSSNHSSRNTQIIGVACFGRQFC